MTLTQQDAADALILAEQSEHRSALLRGYQSTAPHLILWGVVWAIGYTANYLLAGNTNFVWLGLIVAGTCGDLAVVRFDRRQRENSSPMFYYFLALFFAFIIASLTVMSPTQPAQVGAFIPLVVAAGYIIAGIIGAPRLTVTGIALGVLTLFGYFALPAWFQLWMAVVGGGGLVIGGVWLRMV